KGKASIDVLQKFELLMSKANVSVEDRAVVRPAEVIATETQHPACAIELPDGTIVTGRTGDLVGAASSCLLNALKVLGGIGDEVKLLSPEVIEPVQRLKVNHMGSVNPRLHANEVLIALSICAATDNLAKIAMEQLPKLKNCQAHSTVILSHVDEKTFKTLGMNVTCGV
ncbi:MAG: DUF1846 family protein, partial [Clostridia bacterium]|nr:DUF1846 family protein [Clostridia bacterium]